MMSVHPSPTERQPVHVAIFDTADCLAPIPVDLATLGAPVAVLIRSPVEALFCVRISLRHGKDITRR